VPSLSIVIASTRPGRAGEPVARWFIEQARAHGGFEAELLDLRAVGLPALDEPDHPRFGNYTREHTRAWSALVRGSDAFVFVIPEYNHGPAPALVNALAYLYSEWNYKAAGFVSYGGVSAGTRAVEATRPILATVRMVAPPEAVHIPFIDQRFSEAGLVPTDEMRTAAAALLDELLRLSSALAPLRRPGEPPVTRPASPSPPAACSAADAAIDVSAS